MNSNYSLWGGRFKEENDKLMKDFNNSLSIDKRLWSQDIFASKCWAKAINRVGLLTDNEYNLIINGLENISKEWSENKFEIQPNYDEDIHTANERRLRELIGDSCAMKLHTGRSRNDQVVTDMKLWIIENCPTINLKLKQLLKVLLKRAEIEVNILMAGYTHLQRAQPIRWSHLLLSYLAPLDRDLERLNEYLKRILNNSPLGCGAIAGNPFNINRSLLSNELGFNESSINSIDATATRDFIYEFLFICVSISTTLSRIAEDFIMFVLIIKIFLSLLFSLN
jgi:argininosuccinate lyase